jgi:hypothetical protein
MTTRLPRKSSRRRTIIDPGGIARGDGAVLGEGGTEFRQYFDGGSGARILILVDDLIAFARLDRHPDDLVGETSRLLRGNSTLLRAGRELVLVVACDLIFLGDVLGGIAHVIAVEGIPQPVLDHGVDHLDVAHLGAVAEVEAMGTETHALLAAGNDDRRIAGRDLLRTERHRTQARAAHLIDDIGGGRDRQAGGQGRLSRRVHALPRGEDLAHHHFRDLTRFDMAPLKRCGDGNGTELVGRERRQCAVERTDGRARRPHDDDFAGVAHDLPWAVGRIDFKWSAGGGLETLGARPNAPTGPESAPRTECVAWRRQK